VPLFCTSAPQNNRTERKLIGRLAFGLRQKPDKIKSKPTEENQIILKGEHNSTVQGTVFKVNRVL